MIKREIDSIPQELRSLSTWILWKKELRDGKETKVPYSASGRRASTTDPNAWGSFEEALAAFNPFDYSGLGCVITPPFIGVDIDHCRNAQTGDLDQRGLDAIKLLDTYGEISQSGTGLHFWLRGETPLGGNRRDGVEIYGHGRYFTMTGWPVEGTPSTVSANQQGLATFHAKYILNGSAITTTAATNGHGIIVTPPAPLDESPSGEDYRMCGQLAEELGRDADLIEKAFRERMPYREKWDTKRGSKNYLRYTIDHWLEKHPAEPTVQAQRDETIIELNTPDVADMPQSVLDGRLGDIYQRRMKVFPIAYAWPVLLTAAGVRVPIIGGTMHKGLIITNQPQTNMYAGLVGPVHSGKSQADLWGINTFGLTENKDFITTKAGSAEGLLFKLHRMQEESLLPPNLLIALDEWRHFFNKAAIDGASFPSMLNSGFNSRTHSVVLSKQREMEVHCQLSFCGGIVSDQFEECFSNTTIGGLYDRFLFGICPTGYNFDYEPFEGQPESIEFSTPTIDGSVWEVTKAWRRDQPQLGRLIEIAVRAAYITAAADGRAVLHGRDLEPARNLMLYQHEVRKQWQPNPGDNPDAKCAHAIKAWLMRRAPGGEWVPERDLKRGLNYNRDKWGPMIWVRVLQWLERAGDIEMGSNPPREGAYRGGRPSRFVRLKWNA